jgi:hypothetical protein
MTQVNGNQYPENVGILALEAYIPKRVSILLN